MMNVFLFMIGTPAAQILLGTGALGAVYGRQSRKLYMADRLIVGFVAEIGLAEIVHLMIMLSGRSLSDAVLLFLAGMTVLGLCSAGIWLWNQRAQGGRTAGRDGSAGWKGSDVTPLVAGLWLVSVLAVIYQIMVIVSGEYVYRTGDMTVETVESFLETDGIYQVNPLTGQSYTGGVPSRIRILCLPTLYGVLCRIFGLSAAELVWKLIPLHVLLMCYLAFGRLAQVLLAGEKRQDRVKRLLFMTLVAAVLSVGDYLYGMDGFGLLYCGSRGVTIRNVVLLPYVFGLALRRKWKLAALCILAEACIVWTFYGMGACLAVTLGMAVLYMVQKRREKGFGGTGREA